MRQFTYVDKVGNKYYVQGSEFKKLGEAITYALTLGRPVKIKYEDGSCL